MSHQNKYLVLLEPEQEFPEQFFSHMFLIMEVIYLARQLQRIFVLPYVHSHPRNSAACERGETDHSRIIIGKRIDPMEYFFEREVLSKYVMTVGFEEFLDISNRHLQTLCCFQKQHGSRIKLVRL